MQRYHKCSDCGFPFDSTDPRCYVPNNADELRKYGAHCAACQILAHEGAPAWALWNDCQGVFACSVFHSRAEARDALKKSGWQNETVVPVRVFREREDREWLRNWEEREAEKYAVNAAAKT